MITIRHNFDKSRFKWIWARYVKCGNIEKHCANSILGVYSKKFSGLSKESQIDSPLIVMDEVSEDLYEAIYFCGVIKKGYRSKSLLANNYRHNVHFAIRPQKGVCDNYYFENWHVDIENGVIERIPAIYELSDTFFKEPYTSHFYTCRIFRWMIGHFHPEYLRDVKHGYPDFLHSSCQCGEVMDTMILIQDLIDAGKNYVEDFFQDECSWNYFTDVNEKNLKMKSGLLNRKEIGNYISENMGGGCGPMLLEVYSEYANAPGNMAEEDMVRFIELGIEEELDMYFPYQERRLITGWLKEN